MLDVNMPRGWRRVSNCTWGESLRGNNAECDPLYRQAEKDHFPHVIGAGWAKSKDNFTDGFLAWLESRGLDLNRMKHKVAIQPGKAEDPQSGFFDWCVFVCFELDK
jgi:hypothetical protein